tara:strand:+ start:24 stop:401 length:378 start_codon:yes stop_codon:yes gene_type:complete
MAFTLNDIKFKPHRYFKGGIQGTMVIGQYTVSVISGGSSPGGFGGSYGSIVEDFKASGTTYDSSSFEVAVWITKGGEWVTDELFEHLTGGGGVIGYRTAAEVDDILHTMFQLEWGNGRVEPEVLA